ncbi:MAG: hypothetical protein RL026_2356 [Pseudomonadota bacterium]|jgi:uncharacterized membrane protein
MRAVIYGLMTTPWGWPVAEALHFIGMCLLFGVVGFLDLRMLGVARHVDLAAWRRLLPVGVGGFALCATTGALFVVTAPNQYLHNPAFLLKMGLLLVAGLNMVLFHAVAARRTWAAGPGGLPSWTARVCAAVSLSAWLGVVALGRVITAFRPPAYDWCPWC